MEVDILGPLSGMLVALPAVAPPPLNMCLMPFAHALAEVCLAVRQVRFNKEAAAMLQRRGVEIAQKLQDVVKATQGLPTGRVEAVARTVTAIGQALNEAAKFLQQFSKKGAFSKLCSARSTRGGLVSSTSGFASSARSSARRWTSNSSRCRRSDSKRSRA